MAFTFFFRDSHTLEMAVTLMAPVAAGRSKIRVWDAGCAMGPEPYTLAIMLAEKMGKFSFKNLFIDATDIDNSNLFGETIAGGEYPWEQLQRIPKDLFARYFVPTQQPEVFAVDRTLREHVRFQRHDLLSLKPAGEGYTLIVCKNVLLHFTAEQRVSVIDMFHQALIPGGFLVMEQTQKMPEELAERFEQAVPDAQVFVKESGVRRLAA